MSFFVESNKCVSCLGCISACPSNAFIVTSNQIAISPEFCNSCGICVDFCPTGAIVPEKKTKSIVEHSEFDVVIVGGGPAGLFSAYHIAKNGLSVVVLERKNEIGSFVSCGEAVAKEPFEMLITPRSEWISAPVKGAILHTPAGRKIRFDHPNAGYILERPLFERYLAQMAISQGSDILTQTYVLDIESENGLAKSIVAQSPFGKIVLSGRFFIGADGIASMIARFCGANPLHISEVYVCAQVLAFVEPIELGQLEFIIGSKYAPSGYAWIFPKGNKIANVGVGICPSSTDKKASTLLPELLDSRFSRWSVIQCRDGVVPSARRIKPLGRGNVLLVGDAGRLTDPLSGGGIVSALTSAKLAAEAIVKCPDHQKETALFSYDKMCQREIGKRLDFMHRIRNIYMNLSDDELEYISEFLERNFAGRTITALDTPRILMGIVRSSPKLLKYWREILVG